MLLPNPFICKVGIITLWYKYGRIDGQTLEILGSVHLLDRSVPGGNNSCLWKSSIGRIVKAGGAHGQLAAAENHQPSQIEQIVDLNISDLPCGTPV